MDDKEKQQLGLREIRTVILEIWDMHDRMQAKFISKADVSSFCDKVERRLALFKAQMGDGAAAEDLETKLAVIEEAVEKKEADKAANLALCNLNRHRS